MAGHSFEEYEPNSAVSPATGSATVHDREQAQLLTAAFDGLS